MDKEKILRLCDEIENDLSDAWNSGAIEYELAGHIVSFAKKIAAEITAPPKSNGDRIRQMTDEELAEMIVRGSICDMCNAHCDAYKTPEDCLHSVCTWLKQEVEKNDER